MRCYFCESELSETDMVCPVCGGKQIDHAPVELQPEDMDAVAGIDTELSTDTDISIDTGIDAIADTEAEVDVSADTIEFEVINSNGDGAEENANTEENVGTGENASTEAKNSKSAAETKSTKAKVKPDRKKRIRIAVIAMAAFLVIAAIVITSVTILYVMPNSTYIEAMNLFNSGDFDAAKELFSDISAFRDAGEMIDECDYQHAFAMLITERFDEAIDMFSALNGYNDSEEMAIEANYQKAVYYLERNQFAEAEQVLSAIHPYKNTEELFREAYIQEVRQLLSRNEFEQASEIILQMHPFEESEELLNEADYQRAQHLIVARRLDDAREILEGMPGYGDSPTLLNEIDYIEATWLKDTGQLVEALAAFKNLGTYKDSEEQLASVKELIYTKGAEAYRQGNYQATISWFSYIDGYKEIDKYYTLMAARDEETMENGMALLDIVEFEDAARIISDSDYYLKCFLGQNTEWELGKYWFNDHGAFIIYHDRYPWFESDYIAFDDEATFYYYTLEDGTHYQYVWRGENKDNWVPFWSYTVISRDEISIHNHFDNLRYTLYRQEGTLAEIRERVNAAKENAGPQTKATMDEYGALGLAYPVADRYVICGSPFGPRLGNDFHGGMDITVSIGTPVYAVGDGVVSGVYTQFSPGGGAGYYMTIELDAIDPKTGYNLRATYMHMEKPTHLKEGERVERGQHIGYSGNTGFTYGTTNADGSVRQYAGHLHIQYSNNGTDGSKLPGIMVNPAWFYPEIEFRDGTHRGLSRERFLEILYADYTLKYPNRAARG